MSAATQSPGADRISDLDVGEWREVLNPFEVGWAEYIRVLTRLYMLREDRDWVPPGPHHEQLLEDYANGDHLIRLAHRRSLKTTCTLAYAIANLEYKSGFHVLWIGNNQELAYEKAHSEFNKLVERNPWLTNLQESNRASDNKNKKEFGHDSTLRVGWLFGGTEGVGADIVVVDDLIKEKGDGDMQEIEEWLSSVVAPIQEDGGQTIVIGTRKTQTDIYSILDTRQGYDFIEYPAVLDFWDAEFREDAPHRRPDPDLYTEVEHPLDPERTCQVLWPERATEYLRDAYHKQGEHAWMREFNLVVQTREGAVYAVFDRERNRTSEDLEDAWLHFNGLDWGSGNPAGFVQFGVELDDEGLDRLHVLDERKFPADGTSAYTTTLEELHREWGVGPVGCDPSDKRGVLDLRKDGIDAVPADNDVDGGIRTVKDLLTNGQLVIHQRCAQLLEEFGAYRYNPSTGRPVDKNDHLLDAMRYGVMAYLDVFRPSMSRREQRESRDGSEDDTDRGGYAI